MTLPPHRTPITTESQAIYDRYRASKAVPDRGTVNATDLGLTTRPAELADFVPQGNI